MGSVWSKEFVQQLSNTYEWSLSPEQCQSYLQFLHTSEIQADDDVAAMLVNYHQDHAIVQALLDQRDRNHSVNWGQIERFVAHVLRSLHKTPITDRAVEDGDMRQLVLANIVRGLPTFRYRSRLTTWIHNIAQTTLYQEHRYRTAQRRAAVTVSIDEFEHLHQGYDQHADLEAAETYAEIERVLAELGDPRLLKILRLKVEGRRLREIGAHLQLSTARVSGLMKVIRIKLQANDHLREDRSG